MYGDNHYGEFIYGISDDLSPDDIQKVIPDLMKFLPKYYQQSDITRAIQECFAVELGILIASNEDIRKQLFIETATWGLRFYEYDLGIPVNTKIPIEQRREVVKARMRGRGTTTKQMIINTAESFTGGEVEIEEVFEKYHFIVRFVGVKGVPSNMKAFFQMIEDVKPAHLTYEIQYTYIIWADLSKYTWQDLNKYTWGELRTSQELIKEGEV